MPSPRPAAGVVRLPGGLTSALGGPRGRRARSVARGPLAALAPVVLLLGLPLAVAGLRQAGCTEGGWAGRTPVWRVCQSALARSVPADHVDRGPLAYLTGGLHLDVPAVSGVVTTTLARLAPGTGVTTERWLLALWMVLAAALLAGVVVAVGTVRGHPAADPVVLALSPVLALTVLQSVALVPVALAVAAVWAHSRGRVVLAGVLAGVALLGGAAAAAVLLAMLLVPGPAGRAGARRLALAAGSTVVLIAGPLAALDAGTLVRPVAAWWERGAGAGSPWFVATLANHPIGATSVAVISALGALAALALGVLLARQGASAGDTALLVLVVLAVTGTAFPPAAALWLVPFVALAGIGWRDALLWGLAEAVHLVALASWTDSLTDPAKGLPAGWYATALALRLLAVGRLGWVVWARASWGGAPATGTLSRLPSGRPVDNHDGAQGDTAYPPVTERP